MRSASFCHLREIASQLWQILSELLGEDINKLNFRSALQRLQLFVISSNVAKDSTQINSINVCPETSYSAETPKTRSQPTNPKNPKPQARQDLTDAPHITSFYDRTAELTTLEQWIVQQQCNLIAILGISGIGKTALTLHLLPQIQHQFEYAIWRNLRTSPPLETILKNLIQFLANQPESELPTTIDDLLSLLPEYLKSHRCLIIFDDVQTILSSGKLAGNYHPDRENYSKLFRLIAETIHNSCFILNSWELPNQIAALTGENSPIRTLKLNGLGAASTEILKEKGLLDEEQWENLINTYQGNPLWLKIVSSTIQELFGGRVAEFLKYDMLFLGEELTGILTQQFNRLSQLEKSVISHVASQSEAVAISELLQDMQLVPSELVNAMQSLGRRSLIETKAQGNKTVFTVGQVVKQYVKSLM